MTIQTQNLKYEELIKNRRAGVSGGDHLFQLEEWDNQDKFDGRLLIIMKHDTKEPVAAVKFSPMRTTSGLLYDKIKNGLLLQEQIDEDERNNIAGIANHLVKYACATCKTSKLNWTLQLLDENFSLRVKVKSSEGRKYFLMRK